MMKRIFVLAALVVTLITATAAACPPRRYYLALGDSIAYGFQSAKAQAGAAPAAFRGYPELLDPVWGTLVNYSCPGESTTSYAGPCQWRASGHALHADYPGAQRDAALAFVRHHPGQVSPITVSLNGNDINEFMAACPPGDLGCLLAGAPAATAAYGARLLALLADLRAAAPRAEIIVVGAYNPNVDGRAFSDPLFAGVNAAQASAAAGVRGRFVDPTGVFTAAALCQLTLVCTAGDAHPSDAGYRALAELVLPLSRR